MKVAVTLGMGCLLVAGLGCRKGPQDNSRVLANVGGEKITQKILEENVMALAPTEAQAKEFLSAEGTKADRAQYVSRLAQMKAILKFAQKEGLDKDPKVRILSEQALASSILQVVMDRRVGKAEPTEAQLKTLYDEVSAQQKLMGQAMPPFEQAKAQLPGLWKQRQMQTVQEAFLKELEQKVPTTYADDMKPAK
jgi:hypothetical protein